jgi:very-short-patch-repair endonuclease
MRGTQSWKTNRSRILRSNVTSAEDKLWVHLRDRRLGGFKFVINDIKRDQALAKLGYKIVRVHNSDVYENIDGVLAHVLAILEKRDI